MIRVSVGSVTIAGATKALFEYALSQVERVAALNVQFAPQLRKNGSSSPLEGSAGSSLLIDGKGPAVRRYFEVIEQTTGKRPDRFRRTADEKELGYSEEQAAESRLNELGECVPASDSGKPIGATLEAIDIDLDNVVSGDEGEGEDES